MSRRILQRLILALVILTLGTGALLLVGSAYAVGNAQLTYARYERTSAGNIFSTFCIGDADLGYHLTWMELNQNGSIQWSDQRDYGAISGCSEGVFFFSQVVGGEHLAVIIAGKGSSYTTTVRFDLYPGQNGLLNQCDVASDGYSPLIRDPRYRSDTAQGIACAFVDPSAVGQAPTPTLPTPIPPTPTPSTASAPLELFTNPNNQGQLCAYASAGTYEIDAACDDQISALRMQPGRSVRVFRDDHLRGPTACITGDDTDFNDNQYESHESLNDSITSFVLYDTVACTSAIPPPQDLSCSAIGAAQVVDGICQKVTDTSYIAVADLTNPDIRVELAHKVANASKGTFEQTKVANQVLYNSGAGTHIPFMDAYDHYFAAINGTEFTSNCILFCTSPTDQSILGISGTTYGENGSGRGEAGQAYIQKFNPNAVTDAFSSFFVYRQRAAQVYRAKMDIPSDEASARKFIQGRIDDADFVISYSAAILDGQVLPDDLDERPKTAIGVSADQRRVFLAVAKKSVRASDLANQLRNAGAYRVILLDGGGSPQYVSYNTNDQTESYSAWFLVTRPVINAVVVYNAAVSTWQTFSVSSTSGVYSPVPSMRMAFDVGTFTAPVTVTYVPMVPHDTDHYVQVGRFYNVSAMTATNTETQPRKPYTASIMYDEGLLPADVQEHDLSLYFWDGTAWQREPSSQVNAETNTVTATPGHFSQWALLAPAKEKVFLPTVQR